MSTMHCRQCEQTGMGIACTAMGVCGKDADVAALQNLVIHCLRGIGVIGSRLRESGWKDASVDRLVMEGLFITVTNVNFDPEDIAVFIRKAQTVKEYLKAKAGTAAAGLSGELSTPVNFIPSDSLCGLIAQGRSVSPAAVFGPDIDKASLRELILYGLKGMAAYADHAAILGETDETVSSFFYTGLAALGEEKLSTDELVSLVLQLGKVNMRCMEILDKAHRSHYQDPLPTKVSRAVIKGPAVIVSGHDLYDLKQLLEQTEGKGINIYTHGEMLPAHGYPALKKYKHLAGHFGTAWQNQQKEFDGLPAAILFTTNCIQKPKTSYADRLFTTGLVGWPNITHISDNKGVKDFTPVISRALELGGFKAEMPGREITVGFGHKTVLSLAGTVVEAVRSGKIKHFFLIGGCDGAKPGRNYYTEFAQKVPRDCVILTLACGKFRFNSLEFGSIQTVPRLLDCGQCNDAYSVIVIASSLAQAFNCTVNDLPLSLVLSWYEQKAVCILLTLLSLGIQNIRLGPTLPAFVSPNLLKLLAEKFHIKPITTPDEDLREILGSKASA